MNPLPHPTLGIGVADRLGMLGSILVDTALCLGGFVLSSLAEYWTHRLMHRVGLKAAAHRRHHERASVGGVWHEFLEHAVHGGPVAALPGALVAWVAGLAAGASLLAGGIVYAAWAAYAHQLQHEEPRACFWLPMPIHYVHHKYDLRDANYGVGTDVWDRLFGTYVRMDWLGDPETSRARKGPLGIRWS